MFPKNAPSGASLALALIALACAPLAARAAEKDQLEADVVVEQDYDSNIFAAESDKQGSLVTIIRPGLHFANVSELGYFRMNGWLSSHTYWDESKLNGIDRGASLEVDRKLTRRFSVFGSGSLQYYADHNEIRSGDSTSQGANGEPVVTPGQIVEGAMPDVNISQGVGGVRYALTALTDLSLSGGPYSVSYGHSEAGGVDNRDRDGWVAGVSLEHQLTSLDRISLGVNANETDQDNIVSGQVFIFEPGFTTSILDLETGKSRSEQQSVNLGWQRTWSPQWSTNLSVGVRRLYTEVDGVSEPAAGVLPTPFGPVANPAPVWVSTDFDDTGPGVVGEFHLSRTFLRSALTFGYTRETRSTSSAVTSDVNVDTFDMQFTHRLAERVTLNLYGSYELYETANDNPVLRPAVFTGASNAAGPIYACSSGKLIATGSGFDKVGQCEVGTSNALHSQLLLLTGRVDWQLRKRLGTFVVFRYYDRSGDEELFGNDYNKYNFGVGVRYFYDLDL